MWLKSFKRANILTGEIHVMPKAIMIVRNEPVLSNIEKPDIDIGIRRAQ